MAHKKAGGSSRNGRDTAGRRLGIKKYGGESVLAGNIIARQRGTKCTPVSTLGLAKIIRFLPPVLGPLSLNAHAATAHTYR